MVDARARVYRAALQIPPGAPRRARVYRAALELPGGGAPGAVDGTLVTGQPAQVSAIEGSATTANSRAARVYRAALALPEGSAPSAIDGTTTTGQAAQVSTIDGTATTATSRAARVYRAALAIPEGAAGADDRSLLVSQVAFDLPEAVTGTATTSQPAQGSNATGTVDVAGTFTGSITTAQPAQSSSATGDYGPLDITGTATTAQAAQSSSAAGTTVDAGEFAGIITTAQAAQSSSASGAYDPLGITGTLATAQAAQRSRLTDTVIDLSHVPPLPYVQIAFNPPTEAPVWEDVTPYVKAFSFSRGRQSPLEGTNVGMGKLTLDNRARTFDPTYTDGPYYGRLKSTRRVRINAAGFDSLEPLFDGFIDGWTQMRENYGNQYVDVPLSDAFRVFTRAKLTMTRPEELTSERVHAVLDAVSWTTGRAFLIDDPVYGLLDSGNILGPVGARSIGVGASAVQETTLEKVPALSHLQDIERTEDGRLFIGRGGAVTFHGRRQRVLATHPLLAAAPTTFGDNPSDPSELPYVDITTSSDDSMIYNEIVVSRPGADDQVVTDAASITEHFPITLSRNTLLTSDDDAAAQAGMLLSRWKDDTLRILNLDLNPHAAPEGDSRLWLTFLRMELGDAYTVRSTPLGGGNRIEQPSVVEGLRREWSAKGNRWAGSCSLSELDQTPYFIIDVSSLDSGAVLGY